MENIYISSLNNFLIYFLLVLFLPFYFVGIDFHSPCRSRIAICLDAFGYFLARKIVCEDPSSFHSCYLWLL